MHDPSERCRDRCQLRPYPLLRGNTFRVTAVKACALAIDTDNSFYFQEEVFLHQPIDNHDGIGWK
jgi:hypothetical protein